MTLPDDPARNRATDLHAAEAASGTAAAPDRGTAARTLLVAAATRIFAAKGYAAASTREICEAAGANVAAIHYHFGDKEGLYRAALSRPMTDMIAAFGRFDDPALSFEQAIRMFLAPFLQMADQPDDLEAHVMRLHLREMVEPSPVFREVIAQHVVPAHDALARMIARHAGVRAVDDGIHQIAFAIVAMAHDYCMSRAFMQQLAPGMLERPRAMERVLDRLVGFAGALLDHEIAQRRGKARKPPLAARARAKSPASPASSNGVRAGRAAGPRSMPRRGGSR